MAGAPAHGCGLEGFQLWVALPPELELGPSESVYLGPERIPNDGPARVLLGSYGTATSAIKAPSPMNYLAVRLKAGERWSYQPPPSTQCSGPPSEWGPFSFRTSCSRAI
jgi:redox-sensitive bicupin YhaK (pirin superfamily)